MTQDRHLHSEISVAKFEILLNLFLILSSAEEKKIKILSPELERVQFGVYRYSYTRRQACFTEILFTEGETQGKRTMKL